MRPPAFASAAPYLQDVCILWTPSLHVNSSFLLCKHSEMVLIWQAQRYHWTKPHPYGPSWNKPVTWSAGAGLAGLRRCCCAVLPSKHVHLPACTTGGTTSTRCRPLDMSSNPPRQSSSSRDLRVATRLWNFQSWWTKGAKHMTYKV